MNNSPESRGMRIDHNSSMAGTTAASLAYEYTQRYARAASEQPPGQIVKLTVRMNYGERKSKTRWVGVVSGSLGLLLVVAAGMLVGTLSAQTGQGSSQSADELVKAVVRNEVAAASGPEQRHLFTSYKKNAKGTQTHIYVETKEAMAGLLIELNGSPLTQAQLQTEDGHLQWLENNPDQLRKKTLREKEDSERSLRIVKALPDAFHYEYAGTENGTATLGSVGATLVKLKFTPNPSYEPPSKEEQVLTGMQGYLLLDTKARRLAKIDGELFKNVEFGWGILGRLDKGGRFVVCQADVGENSWEITQMKLDITGKILLLKSFSMVSEESLSDFRRVPDLTFAQGVQLLKAEQVKIAGHAPGPQTALNKLR